MIPPFIMAKLIQFIAFAVFSVVVASAGDLKVTLSPAAAVTAGARWRVDNGAWKTSDSTVTSLAKGNHTISYAAVPGWVTPPSETVAIPQKGLVALTRSYVAQKYQLTVQYGSGSGNYTAGTSVAIVAESRPDSNFAGWVGAPVANSTASSTTLVMPAANASVSATFVLKPTGYLSVLASPDSALRLGAAKVRVDGGSWIACDGASIRLITGTHALEFAQVAGWTSPASTQVTISEGQTTNLDVDYLLTHRLRFFLAPELVGTLSPEELRYRLSQYAVDIQRPFQTQTHRRLIFDPANDITITSTAPDSGSYTGVLPEVGYEVWVYARLSTNTTYGTYGGRGSLDSSGAAVATGLYWDQIYDPSQIVNGTNAAKQYCTQIDHATHEIEHGFGAGFGEYYSGGGQWDNTGVEPILPEIPAVNAQETFPFWDAHQDFWADPLLCLLYENARFGYPSDLAYIRNTVKLARATVAVVDGCIRGDNMAAAPDLSAVRVRVVDSNGLPVNGATVRVWNRLPPGSSSSTTVPTEYVVATTAEPNVFTFRWANYPASVFNNYDNMVLIKVWAPGYQPSAHWEWAYDTIVPKLVDGKTSYEVVVRLIP